ncbi:MAG: YdcF family protein [Clostridia bacterium]|nr:YdcF family protein [Clostridia bacterium]
MKKTYDAILLLGLALTQDSQPRPELIARIDEAAKAWHEGLLGETGLLIPCGGVLPGRTRSEAEVMAAELKKRGVPRERMRLEDKSQVTMENMRFAARLLENPKKARVLVITGDYHLFRSVLTARRVGLRAKGRAAVLAHDAAWKECRNKEFAYTVDLICGWQDEGKSRPEWTGKLFDWVFGKK